MKHPSEPSPFPERTDPARLESLRRYARLLDSAWTIPGTRIRIGVDSLVGLLPGIGDVAGLGLSLWVLAQARRHGAPKRLLARMAANVGMDALVGAIPLLGDAFDVWFRANQRNVALLEQHLATRGLGEERYGVPAGAADGAAWVEAEVIEPAPRRRADPGPDRRDAPLGASSPGTFAEAPPEPSYRPW